MFNRRLAEISKEWREAPKKFKEDAIKAHQDAIDAITQLLRDRPDEAGGENATEVASLLEDINETKFS